MVGSMQDVRARIMRCMGEVKDQLCDLPGHTRHSAEHLGDCKQERELRWEVKGRWHDVVEFGDGQIT